jgi:mannitol/fructose-specific phosphotransferase system IIA component (Ntr-type)
MNTKKTGTLATLADHTKPELIISQLATRTIVAVMQELDVALQRLHNSAPEAHRLFSSVAALHQELLASNIADLGATFPHVRVAALCRPRFVLGRSGEPLPWLAPAFRPIDLVFLILQPASADAEFGQLLSTLRDLGKSQARLDDLRGATTSDEMFAVLARIPLMAVTEVMQPIPAAAHSRLPRTAGSYRWWRR